MSCTKSHSWLQWHLQELKFLILHYVKTYFLHFAPGLYHTTEGGLQSAVIFSNVRVREFEAQCVRFVVGGGKREFPFHYVAPSKSRLRDPERGWGGTSWEIWNVCMCESQRACAVPMHPPPSLPPSIPPFCSLCIALSSQHQRRTPPPLSL